MKKYSVIVTSYLTLCSAISCIAQKPEIERKKQCVELMDQIGYYWRLDSVANNGFRFSNYHFLLECQFQGINETVVRSLLGSPNEVSDVGLKKALIYYYFDIRKMPAGYDKAPLATLYISFNFRRASGVLIDVTKGDIDR